MAAEITRGLFNVVINVIESDGDVSSTMVDAPRARSLGLTGESDRVQIEGDDVVLDVTSLDERFSWDLEMAGLSLAFVAALEGGTVSTSGSGATLVNFFIKTDATIRPNFQMRGHSKSKDGGALVVTLHNCTMLSGPNLPLAYGEYMRPAISGEATYNDEDPRQLYTLSQQAVYTELA
jgi:hypothetical protein